MNRSSASAGTGFWPSASSARRLVGVVHLAATPGSPRSGVPFDLAHFCQAARADAMALARGGADAIIVENFGDAPFFAGGVPPETVAALTLALEAVREAVVRVGRDLPIGVNVLRNDARAGLGLCAATGAHFVRVNVHTGAAVTDQGLIAGRAAETVRERERLCPGVELWCDVHVKHATPLGGESLAEAAGDTVQRGLADVVIVSGRATGAAPEPDRVRTVRAAVGTKPLLVGSGLDLDNADALLEHADGAVVGTWLKQGGDVARPIDVERVALMRARFDACAG